MTWNDRSSASGGVHERGFDVTAGGRSVPGVYWNPGEADAERLVLLGHGGTTHKKVDYIEQMAARLAERGIASMAIDGPGHGERATGDLPDQDSFASAWQEGGGNDGMIADWRAALDFIEAACGPRPTGWWGLSMGTMMGLPVCATDDRIRVALLGLMGNWGPNGDDLLRLAPAVTCPIRFLVQWDDEIVPRERCLTLFDAIGASRKTLHANPGAHAEVPQNEINDSVNYLDRYLR